MSSIPFIGQLTKLALLAGVIVCGASIACGAERTEQPGTAYLRCFAELGKRGGDTTYSVTLAFRDATAPKEARVLLHEINGGATLNPGKGAMSLPAVTCDFVLKNNQTGETARLSETLADGSMYSLLVYLENNRPALRLVQEYSPDQDQAPGYVIHHLLSDIPLLAAFGDNPPRQVSASAAESAFIPAREKKDGPLSLTYPSERGTPRVRDIEPVGSGRRILVFLRNGYGQTSVRDLTVEPEVEQGSSEAALSSEVSNP